MRVDRAALADRGVIEVSGVDARALLQRLVTNDVDQLEPGKARYAALLTPQGKIISDFFIVADPRGDGTRFLMDVPSSTKGDLVKKLTLYRLRAKVEVRDRSDELAVMAIADGVAVDGALVFADPRADGLWNRAIVAKADLGGEVGDAGRWAYRQHRIAAGIPEGGLDFAYGETFPHEANLDRLHGVDFKKGCYVGQEVVSRVEHRGTARKRVVGVGFEGDAPDVGSDIVLDGGTIGVMGSAVDGLGLALLRLDRAEEARRSGTPVTAAGITLHLDGPGWPANNAKRD